MLIIRVGIEETKSHTHVVHHTIQLSYCTVGNFAKGKFHWSISNGIHFNLLRLLASIVYDG